MSPLCWYLVRDRAHVRQGEDLRMSVQGLRWIGRLLPVHVQTHTAQPISLWDACMAIKIDQFVRIRIDDKEG